MAAGAEQGAIDGMLSNEGTRNELLHAAFTAEARAFLMASIVGAFRRCGLWPFVPERMIAQVADALGMGHSDKSTRGLAAAAAADVIQEASSRSKAAKKPVVYGLSGGVTLRFACTRRVVGAEPGQRCKQGL